MPAMKIPTVVLPNFTCKKYTKEAIIEAIKQGYRHFDTAAAYGLEQTLGEALKEALDLGLMTREELFVTSKLWITDNHPHVVSALPKSLRTLQLEYLDLYLIHRPLGSQPGKFSFPIDDVEDLLPFDVKGVWESMEECQKLGLTRAIGVSNFSVNKLQNLSSIATIRPIVNQVEMNLAWQHKKLREFCGTNGIMITAFSPLRSGLSRGPNEVNDVLKEIAEPRGKSIA